LLLTAQIFEVSVIDLPKETLAAFDGDELRARVFYEKYALRDMTGKQVETTPKQMWKRVAREIASVEATEEKRKEWEEKFYWLLEDWKFIPGGRILFGAGQERKSTLLNCYVIPIKADSIEAIFDWCKEAARTYSYGGGVGTDISILRPKGAPVNNSAIVSTGSVSFMEVMSTTTGTIGQAGRRGALMISISIEHPDIEDFINVKRNLSKVNYANISVRITDAFMKAVENNEEFMLHFKNDKVEVNRKVKAKEIWNKLIKAAWESDEPGLLFWDTTKRMSTSEYNGMEVIATNPCAEIPLDPYGCCCLGSLNLSAFVELPFVKYGSRLNMTAGGLVQAAAYATRFLDNVITYNSKKHPLLEQSIGSLSSRRIGVGFTGLGDMLIKLGKRYDDEETIAFVDEVFSELKNRIYQYSTMLAEEKGTFPAFDLSKHMAQPFISKLPEWVRDCIKENGLRNVALMTVPPVGSGSVLAGTSSGVEPVFAFKYKRRSKSLSQSDFDVSHPLIKEYYNLHKFDETTLPDYFVASHQIKPEFRVKMQAAIQKHIDHSISSTVNLPQNIALEEVEKIYFYAWKLGCKGITVYREGSRQGILETLDIKKD
jgi:ribonucleoside-diphosphate reductase alpha chain